jgi:hypothetical protein
VDAPILDPKAKDIFNLESWELKRWELINGELEITRSVMNKYALTNLSVENTSTYAVKTFRQTERQRYRQTDNQTER